MDALSAQFCINKRYFHRDKAYSRSRRAIGATGGSLGHRLAQPESADADGDRSPRGDQLIRAGDQIAISGLKNRARSARSTCARETGVLFFRPAFDAGCLPCSGTVLGAERVKGLLISRDRNDLTHRKADARRHGIPARSDGSGANRRQTTFPRRVDSNRQDLQGASLRLPDSARQNTSVRSDQKLTESPEEGGRFPRHCNASRP